MQKHLRMQGNREGEGKCVRVKKQGGKRFCMREKGSQRLLLSVYRKCKGNRRAALPMGNTSALCFEKAVVVLLDVTVISHRLPWNRNSLWFAALSYPENCRKKEIA